MQYITVIVISAILSFGTGWQVQSWRYGAKETEHESQRATMLEQRRLADAVQLERLGAVQAQAAARTLVLRRAATDAHRESDGLRDAIVALSAQPVADAQAATDRATAFGAALADCSDRYKTMGAVADRHASDVQTLSDAWPTE